MKRITLLILVLVGISTAHAQWRWGIPAGGSQSSIINSAMAVDNSGASYVAGSIAGTITIGNFTLASPWGGAYLAKIDADGNVLKAISIPVPDSSPSPSGNAFVIKDIATTEDGIYIAGYFRGTISEFGLTTLTTSLFVAKYSTQLINQWIIHSTPNSSVYSYATISAIEVDQIGNCYFTGDIEGANLIGAKTTNVANGHFIVGKVTPTGIPTIISQFGVPLGQFFGETKSLGIDKSENLYVTGRYMYDMSFGAFTLNSINPQPQSYVACITRIGKVKWAIGTHAPSPSSLGRCDVSSIVNDGSGNSYITGFISHEVVFGSQMHQSTFMDIFVARISSNGNFLWSEQSTQNDYADASSIAYDEDEDNIYVSGTYNSNSFNFQNFTLPSPYFPGSTFIFRLASDGKAVEGMFIAPSNSPSIIGGLRGETTTRSIFLAGSYYDVNLELHNPETKNESSPLIVPEKGPQNAFVAKHSVELPSLKDEEQGITLYPNPTANYLVVGGVCCDNIEHVTVVIRDQRGFAILKREIFAPEEKSIDISALRPGLYMLEVVGNGKKNTKSFYKN